MRLAGLAKGGYYPTPMRCVDLVSNLVTVQTQNRDGIEETIRILDPCCGPGDACERLAAKLSHKSNAEIRTFGVELERGTSPAGPGADGLRPILGPIPGDDRQQRLPRPVFEPAL